MIPYAVIMILAVFSLLLFGYTFMVEQMVEKKDFKLNLLDGSPLRNLNKFFSDGKAGRFFVLHF